MQLRNHGECTHLCFGFYQADQLALVDFQLRAVLPTLGMQKIVLWVPNHLALQAEACGLLLHEVRLALLRIELEFQGLYLQAKAIALGSRKRRLSCQFGLGPRWHAFWKIVSFRLWRPKQI